MPKKTKKTKKGEALAWLLSTAEGFSEMRMGALAVSEAPSPPSSEAKLLARHMIPKRSGEAVARLAGLLDELRALDDDCNDEPKRAAG